MAPASHGARGSPRRFFAQWFLGLVAAAPTFFGFLKCIAHTCEGKEVGKTALFNGINFVYPCHPLSLNPKAPVKWTTCLASLATAAKK